MTAPGLEFDRELLGKEFPAGTFRVDKERILAYCEAIGETNPMFTDEEAAMRSGYRSLVAPPSFCNLLERTGVRPDIKLKFPGTGIHQWQAFESFRPICAGDVLDAKIHLKDAYTRPGRTGLAAVVVWETVLRDPDGEAVATVQHSFMTRPLPSSDGA